jgi:hypothetical protein
VGIDQPLVRPVARGLGSDGPGGVRPAAAAPAGATRSVAGGAAVFCLRLVRAGLSGS